MKLFSKNIITYSFLVFFILASFSFPIKARSIILIPFGGFVLASFPCNVNAVFLLTIGPPFNGTVVYQVGSPQFDFMQLPRPGVYVLGTYAPVGVCLVWNADGDPEAMGNPLGTITPMVGTSL